MAVFRYQSHYLTRDVKMRKSNNEAETLPQEQVQSQNINNLTVAEAIGSDFKIVPRTIHTKYGKVIIGSGGYYQITSTKEGKHNKLLHRMIYEDSFEEIPENCLIHHIDADKTNNNVKNLQCMSKKFHNWYHNYKNPPRLGAKHSLESRIKMSENHVGMFGKKQTLEARKKIAEANRGENSPNVKITEKNVIQIRQLKKQGISRKKVYNSIVKPLGLSFAGFRAVWENKTWKHLGVE